MSKQARYVLKSAIEAGAVVPVIEALPGADVKIGRVAIHHDGSVLFRHATHVPGEVLESENPKRFRTLASFSDDDLRELVGGVSVVGNVYDFDELVELRNLEKGYR